MHVKLRYVERRVDRSGTERWYWHRRGHKLTRLPDSAIERMAMAERLNAAADSLSPAELERGTIGWVIQRYRDSDEYRDLSLGTVKYYKRFLREIEALGPRCPSRRLRAVPSSTSSKATARRTNGANRPRSSRTCSSSPDITASLRRTRPPDCA